MFCLTTYSPLRAVLDAFLPSSDMHPSSDLALPGALYGYNSGLLDSIGDTASRAHRQRVLQAFPIGGIVGIGHGVRAEERGPPNDIPLEGVHTMVLNIGTLEY